MAKAVLIDISGQRFGRLTVIGRAENSVRGKARWLCRCDCGREIVVAGTTLRYGDSRSCGHRDAETRRKMGAANRKHGMDGTPEYRAWINMRGRCNNPEHRAYRHYGGRGVAVCQQWNDNFEAFYADMGARPTASHSIDRIDVDGDYEPSNCRWATTVQQARNQSQSRYIEIAGRVVNLADEAERLGVTKSVLYNRARRGTHGIQFADRPIEAAPHKPG